MKKGFWFIIMILTFIGCRDKGPRFSVRGEGFEPYNGQKVYLDRIDPELLEDIRIDSTVVKKGQFRFTGDEDTLHLYRIWYGENYFLYFPEQGETVLDTVNWYARTTPRLAQYWRIWKGDPHRESRQFIKENIQNALGLYLFDWFYNIPPEDLPELYERMITTQGHTSTARNLGKILEENPAITPGRPFNDFTLNDTKGTPVTFSHIAGRGEYTGLLILMDSNHPEKIEQIVQEWMEEYKKQGIRIVIVTHESSPNRELIENLRKIYGPRNKRLIYLWENRRAHEIKAHERYRVGQMNYGILFDPTGYVLKTEVIE